MAVGATEGACVVSRIPRPRHFDYDPDDPTDLQEELHSDTCRCEGCNELRGLRGLPQLPLFQNFEERDEREDDRHVGGDDFEGHYYGIRRIEPRGSVL